MMVDVQYRWRDAKSALRTLRSWADLDLFFVETPLPPDDLDGYAHAGAGSADADRRRANG